MEAVDGPDDELRALAAPEAVATLLHPGDPDPADPKTRVVVRGAQVRAIDVVGLAPSPEPATVTVAIAAHGARYIQNRDTVAVLSGSRDEAADFTERWTLALTGDASAPWRIVAA